MGLISLTCPALIFMLRSQVLDLAKVTRLMLRVRQLVPFLR